MYRKSFQKPLWGIYVVRMCLGSGMFQHKCMCKSMKLLRDSKYCFMQEGDKPAKYYWKLCRNWMKYPLPVGNLRSLSSFLVTSRVNLCSYCTWSGEELCVHTNLAWWLSPIHAINITNISSFPEERIVGGCPIPVISRGNRVVGDVLPFRREGLVHASICQQRSERWT